MPSGKDILYKKLAGQRKYTNINKNIYKYEKSVVFWIFVSLLPLLN